jgi:hypothetical protein
MEMWSGSEYLDVENNGTVESMQKDYAYGMHKVHIDYKNAEQRRDVSLLLRVIQACRRRQCVATEI